MLKPNRVTQAIVGKHSFEAGLVDMFKNLFKSEPKKDSTPFDMKEAQRDDRFRDLLEKTFLKPKWVEDNCVELIVLDNHKFPFLSMYQPKEEFITSDELLEGLKTFNEKIDSSFDDLGKAYVWGSKVFKEANEAVKKVRPKDRSFQDGSIEESDLSSEEVDEIDSIIDDVMEKYSAEHKKHAKVLDPISLDYSPFLENDKSNFKLKGKSIEIKITISEMVEFLKRMKGMDILDDAIPRMYTLASPTYEDSEPVYITSSGYDDFYKFLFLDRVYYSGYEYGNPTNFYSLKTLAEVLKQFVDK